MNTMKRKRCILCHGENVNVLFERDRVPVFQNALYRDSEAARGAGCGRLVLMICANCGATFNGAFDSQLVIYDQTYENNQSGSAVFFAHMQEMADRILSIVSGPTASLVEVGCGQGEFLRLLKDRAGASPPYLAGFDPAYRGKEDIDGVKILREFLSRQAMVQAGPPPTVIVTRHVIEHVPDPVGFLSMIASACGDACDFTLFIETPCFDWILKNRVIQDVFYEHVNYFTATTLAFAAEQAGFVVDSIDHVFQGQYLWLVARPAGPGKGGFLLRAGDSGIGARAVSYAAEVADNIAFWRNFLADDTATAVWGGGAKGVTFSGLIDPHGLFLKCIIDINPAKQGAYCAGTALPIVAPQEAAALGVQRAIVMNPIYFLEIETLVRQLNLRMSLINVADRN